MSYTLGTLSSSLVPGLASAAGCARAGECRWASSGLVRDWLAPSHSQGTLDQQGRGVSSVAISSSVAAKGAGGRSSVRWAPTRLPICLSCIPGPPTLHRWPPPMRSSCRLVGQLGS